MTATDIRYGRQGGRVVPWVEMPGDTVVVVCLCSNTWLVVARDVGRPCWTCGAPLRRLAAA